MLKRGSKLILLITIAFFIIFFIVDFFVLNNIQNDRYHYFNNLLKLSFDISFIVLLAFNLRTRITDERTIRSIWMIFILLAVWLSTKYIKYDLVNDELFERLLWYNFYIYILFIPICFFEMIYSMVFFHSKIKKRIFYVIAILGVLLAILVLTNDLHHLVFIIEDANHYSYNVGYFIIISYCAILVGSSLVLAIINTIKTEQLFISGVIILFIVLTLTIVYYVLHAFSFFKGVLFLNDITAVSSFLIVIVINIMIYAGILPINMEPETTFYNSNMKFVITTNSNKIYNKTAKETFITNDVIESIEGNSALIDNHLIIKEKIKNGYIYYEKDIEGLIDLREKILAIKTDLEEKVKLERKNNEIKAEILENKYKSELYESFNDNIKTIIDDLKYIEETADYNTDQKIKRISLILTYLKRVSIFSVFKEANEVKDTGDLVLAFNELIEFLRKIDFNLNILFFEKTLTSDQIIHLYQGVYELIVLCIKNDLNEAFVRIIKKDNTYEIVLTTDSLKEIKCDYDTVLDDSTLIIRMVI